MENIPFRLTPGNYTIQFSFLGYESIEVPVTIAANETVTINKTLGSGSYKLEDVVIKATATIEKKKQPFIRSKKSGCNQTKYRCTRNGS